MSEKEKVRWGKANNRHGGKRRKVFCACNNKGKSILYFESTWPHKTADYFNDDPRYDDKCGACGFYFYYYINGAPK